MSTLLCNQCEAPLAAGARFCRQCGLPLDETAEAVTRNLASASADFNYQTSRDLPPLPISHARKPVIRNLLLVALAALLGVGVYWFLNRPSLVVINRSLVYPNAAISVEMQDAHGSSLQMQTPDDFNKVAQWYAANLNPTKTLKISEHSVNLKADKTSIMIVSEDGLTNVVIKQTR